MTPRSPKGLILSRLFDHFERTLIVNLPDRADRRRETAAALAPYGVKLSVEPPTDVVRGGRVAFFAATRPDDAGGFPSRGARGCFLSHLRALTVARDAGWPGVLILEDDAEPLPALAAAGPALLDELASRPWDVAMLGVMRYGDKPTAGAGVDRKASDAARQWLPLDRPIIGTQSYAVSETGLPKVIALLEAILGRQAGDPAGGPMHLDGAYYHVAQDGGVTALVASPSLFGQRLSRSDVAGAKLVDRLPLVRTAAAALRRMRG